MSNLRILIPALVTLVLTILAVLSAIWLTGLVPPGDWARFIRAAIVVFIIGSTLLIIAWSAYFIYIIRQSLRD